MTETSATLTAIVVVFVVGCIFIYTLKKYFIRALGAEYNANSKLTNDSFVFNTGYSFKALLLTIVLLFVISLVYQDCQSDKVVDKELYDKLKSELEKKAETKVIHKIQKNLNSTKNE